VECAVSKADGDVENKFRDVPNLFIAAKPPTRKPREMRRRGLVILKRQELHE
jgi:hypothetical protein